MPMRIESAVLRKIGQDKPDSRVVINGEETPQVVSSVEACRGWLENWELAPQSDLDFASIAILEEALTAAIWLPHQRPDIVPPLLSERQKRVAMRRLLLCNGRDQLTDVELLASKKGKTVAVVTAAAQHAGVVLTLSEVFFKLATPVADKLVSAERELEIVDELWETPLLHSAHDRALDPEVSFEPNSFTEVFNIVKPCGKIGDRPWQITLGNRCYGILVDAQGQPWLATDQTVHATELLETKDFAADRIQGLKGEISNSTIPTEIVPRMIRCDLKGGYRGEMLYRNDILMISRAWRQAEPGS